jgi:acetyl esterase
VRLNAGALDIDPERLIVCGDSSGANLVAVICHELRARGDRMPLAQILIYPSVALSKHRGYASWDRYGKGFLIGENSLVRTLKFYLPDAPDIEDPRASPLLYPDFSGQPPALVITADHDPIRDGGREYAAKLVAAGVDTRFVEYPGTIHGFMSLGVPNDAAGHALGTIRDFVLSIE